MKPIQELFSKSVLLPVSLLVIGLCAALCPVHLHAQGYGAIVGTITDPTGAAIPTAKITVTQTATGRTIGVDATAQGTFVFPSLAPAEYNLTVSAPGFQVSEQKGIVLQADQSLNVNMRLVVGAATEKVEVTTAAAGVDTTTSTLSQVIGEENVVDLPLNGRNAAALVTLVAGVVIAPEMVWIREAQRHFPPLSPSRPMDRRQPSKISC